MKKVMTFILTLLMCVGMLIFVSQNEVQAETVVNSGTIYGMSWRVTDDGVLHLGTAGRTETLNAGTSTKSYYSWSALNQYNYSSGNPNGLKVERVVMDGPVNAIGDISYMFANYQGQSIDLRQLNTTRVTSMSSMFSSCSASMLNISNFDTSNVQNMDFMFSSLKNIESLDLSHFYTPNLTSCARMFYSASSLRSLDIQNMDLRNVSSDGLTSMLASRDGSSSDNWGLKKIVLGPHFVFGDPDNVYNANAVYLRDAQGSNYSIKRMVNDGVTDWLYMYGWINKDRGLGAYSSFSSLTGDYSINALACIYDESMAGTWEWGYTQCDVYVEYDGGDGAVGSMPLQHVHKDVASYTDGNWGSIKLLNNTFVKPGYEFDHWEMDTSFYGVRSLDDGASIYWPTYEATNSGDDTTDVRLLAKAVWKKRDTSLNWNGNEAEFSIRGGEQAVLDNIPAGTSYQVYELTPDGWVLVQQENASGVIEALEESSAAFWNKYQPGVTTVQFSGLKNLDGRPASAGKFTFELYEGDTLVDTATTQDGGFIQFKVIEYDAAGNHTYTIREVDSGDDSIDYDTHEETVTVEVTDDGAGHLSSEVEYDDDGIVFSNTTRPGTLRITKDAMNGTSQNVNDEFTIEIEFRNESGMPINDNIYWYVEGDASPSEISDGTQE